MNSRRRYSISVCFIYGLEEKNSKSEVIFAVCRLPLTSCSTSLIVLLRSPKSRYTFFLVIYCTCAQRQHGRVQANSIECLEHVDNASWPAAGYPSHAVQQLCYCTYPRHQHGRGQAFSAECLEHVDNASWLAAGHPSHAVQQLCYCTYMQHQHGRIQACSA